LCFEHIELYSNRRDVLFTQSEAEVHTSYKRLCPSGGAAELALTGEDVD